MKSDENPKERRFAYRLLPSIQRLAGKRRFCGHRGIAHTPSLHTDDIRFGSFGQTSKNGGKKP